MDAGRVLDIEIAQQVCDLFVLIDSGGNHKVISPRRKIAVSLPFYSTETEHAYFLVHLLQSKGFYCHAQAKPGQPNQPGPDEPRYHVAFYREGATHRFIGVSTSLAHAICLAALQIARQGVLGE